jgi:hypothetical protein
VRSHRLPTCRDMARHRPPRHARDVAAGFGHCWSGGAGSTAGGAGCARIHVPAQSHVQ